jgi:hypothetical protein
MDKIGSMTPEASDKATKERAKAILGYQGKGVDTVYSKSAVSKEKMRPYKKGGLVKNCK